MIKTTNFLYQVKHQPQSVLQYHLDTSENPGVKAQRSEQVMWSFLDNNPTRDEDTIHEIHPDEVDNDDLYKDPLLAAELPGIDEEETPTISLFPMTDNKRKAIGKKKTKPNFRTKRNK